MADYSKSQIPKTGQLKGEDLRDTLLGGGAVFTLPAGAVNANYMPNYFSDGAKINKWAKYKPIISSEMFSLTEDQRKLASYGINIPTGYGSYAYIQDDIKNGTLADWEYKLPKGGASERFRTADFCGYNHKAMPPIRSGNNGTVYIESGVSSFSLGYYINEGGDNSLKLTDLRLPNADYFDDLYFGVFMFNSQRAFCCTNNVKLKEMSLFDAITVQVKDVQTGWTGTYTAVPIFSTRPISTLDSSTVGTIYAIPFIRETISIALRVSQVTVSGGAFWNVYNTQQLYYGFQIYNNRDTVLDTGTIYMELLNSSKNTIWTKTFPTQTIGNRSVYVYPAYNEMADQIISGDIASNAKYIRYRITPLGGIYNESSIGVGDPNNP